MGLWYLFGSVDIQYKNITLNDRPVMLNLFQHLAHDKSHYPLNFIATSVNLRGKKTLQKLYIFIGGRILKQVQDDGTLSVVFLY
ncbi:MAG: hypothetical protein LBK53_08415 [Heliobacteriaceae bacterium]|jgi:hypothetical protein|nr:hypothetical protein [Heliobacteriaceae bacterium]